MKRQWLIALLTLLGVVCAVWLFSNFENREPLHKGRPISYWIDQPHQNNEVKEIGQTAVPYLVARLQDTWWRTGWNKFHRLLPAQLRHKLPSYEPASDIQSLAANYDTK